jgi:uncharacterized membrane protein YdfJ with MMPL/SSD domain
MAQNLRSVIQYQAIEEAPMKQNSPSRSKETTIGIGLSIGMSFGVAFGALMGDVGLGLVIGMTVGMIAGAAMASRQ